MAVCNCATAAPAAGGADRVEAVLEEPLVLDHSRRGSMSQASRPAHEDVHAFVSEAHA